jgi:amino acid adenylation domain-containing protein
MATMSQPACSIHSSRRSLAEVVSARAQNDPTAAALVCGGETLSYRELDRRSNRLARYLLSLGVGPEVPVGLCLPRSFGFVIAALGIWKAGGAYAPLDPASPRERLSFMLEDAQIPVLISNDPVARPNVTVVDLHAADSFAESELPEAPPTDLAYIIYTSGSTGSPKGVEITHAGLANLVSWHQREFLLTADDRASHVAGLGFDAAVWELWPYLAAGASVYLCDDVTRTSPELLRDWLAANRITIGFVPTALAERMLLLEWPAETAALRLLLTGGDTLHHSPPPDLPFDLINNYGPTESTVVATSGRVTASASSGVLPPIGRPIDNTCIYLLDQQLREVADGTPGEIHIASAGLARGYRNSPQLTAEKFIANSFQSGPDGGALSDRLYKTGDLARRLPDGQYEFLGRIDNQVKIRGYRIEPQEIVAAINRRPGVCDSVVLAREDASGEKRLIAYLMVDPAFDSTASDFREALRADLPEYMLPAALVKVDAFPLNLHGKLDPAALPDPDSENMISDQPWVLPRTETETRVAEIVGDLLGVEGVGADDNFFMLGGHSLLGTQLIGRLRKDFGIQIPLRTLFAAPTVAELAAEIDRLQGAS